MKYYAELFHTPILIWLSRLDDSRVDIDQHLGYSKTHISVYRMGFCRVYFLHVLKVRVNHMNGQIACQMSFPQI